MSVVALFAKFCQFRGEQYVTASKNHDSGLKLALSALGSERGGGGEGGGGGRKGGRQVGTYLSLPFLYLPTPALIRLAPVPCK